MTEDVKEELVDTRLPKRNSPPIVWILVLVIIALLLSNTFLAVAYFDESDSHDDDDSGEGPGDNETRTQISGNLTVYQAYTMIQNNTNNSRFVIIDVRHESDYREGHIHKAINLYYFNESHNYFLSIFDKNLTYLVYCDGGLISHRSVEHMADIGYMEVYHLLNGLERWKELGYEVESSDA